MYAGYGLVTKEELTDIYNILKDFNCHHIFIDDNPNPSKSDSGFNQALSQLQSNDILVIPQIHYLAPSHSFLLSRLEELLEKNIHLHILDSNLLFCWGQSSHCTLLKIIQQFQLHKNQVQTLARKQTLSNTGKTAGANTKITQEKRQDIETLISQNFTRKEICHRAQISETTFKNHFGSIKEARKQLVQTQAHQAVITAS